MLAAMVAAALLVDGIFSSPGSSADTRPKLAVITERAVGWNYTTVLNVVFLALAAVLVALTLRRGAKDPVCGMTVDRAQTPWMSRWRNVTFYFCGRHCKHRFDAAPEDFA